MPRRQLSFMAGVRRRLSALLAPLPPAPAGLHDLPPDHEMGSWVDDDPLQAIARAHR
jgi:hypothetical protein